MRFRRLATGAGLVLVMSAAPLALAADYPPSSEAAGEVTPSRIKAGECATFSGRGFSALVVITVTDNDDAAGTTRTDVNGEFSKELCYGTDAKRGKHVLKGTGDAPDGTTVRSSALRTAFSVPSASAAVRRTVTANLIVTGVSQRDEQPAAGGSAGGPVLLPRSDVDLDGSVGSGSGLPLTGLSALLVAVLGAALVAVGGALLIVVEQRHRRRRRQRLA